MTLLQKSVRTLAAAMLGIAMAACGGGGSSVAAAPAVSTAPPVDVTPPAPEVVEGIATPTTVAVVTATNAS